MVLSTSIGSVDVMVVMARALRAIPNEDIVFIQYPVIDADPELYPGRVVPNESLAADVIARLQADESFTLAAGSSGSGSTEAGSEFAAEFGAGADSGVIEGLVGQTAGDKTCTVPR